MKLLTNGWNGGTGGTMRRSMFRQTKAVTEREPTIIKNSRWRHGGHIVKMAATNIFSDKRTQII